MNNHSINFKSYATVYRKTLKEVPRTIVAEKMIKNSKKIQKLVKIANAF